MIDTGGVKTGLCLITNKRARPMRERERGEGERESERESFSLMSCLFDSNRNCLRKLKADHILFQFRWHSPLHCILIGLIITFPTEGVSCFHFCKTRSPQICLFIHHCLFLYMKFYNVPRLVDSCVVFSNENTLHFWQSGLKMIISSFFAVVGECSLQDPMT